jgi:Xaa-Pro aminopeptidase
MTDAQTQAAASEVQPHPSIPDDELRRRPGALGRALAEAGFDGWIAFGDDRAVYGPDHIRFLADIEPHFEPVFLAGRTDSAAALLLTGPETIGYAAVVTARAAISEIVAMDELSHPEEEYPTISLSSGSEVLRELLAGAKRIAVIGMDAVAHPVWQRLIAPLAEAGHELASGDDVSYRLRSIKTDAEQAVIDEAYRIARVGLETAAQTTKPGVSEREVAAEAEAAMRRAGAEGFGIDTMVASGHANTSPILARSTFRTIRAEDLVCVTLAPRYEGYHAALARPFLFRSNPEVEAAIEVALEGQRAGAQRLVVGTEGREAARAIRETVEGADTGAELPYVPVHTVGLIEFEPPIFLSSSTVTIEDGMALSIDAALFHGPWGGLRVEDGFAIRGGGAVPRFADYEQIVPVML